MGRVELPLRLAGRGTERLCSPAAGAAPSLRQTPRTSTYLFPLWFSVMAEGGGGGRCPACWRGEALRGKTPPWWVLGGRLLSLPGQRRGVTRYCTFCSGDNGH